MLSKLVQLDKFIPAIKVYENIYNKNSISFFLDSSQISLKSGRFSFIGIDPFLTFKSKGKRIEITSSNKKKIIHGNPFNVLKQLLKEYNINGDSPHKRGLSPFMPFLGGAVGYFSYDLALFIEKVPSNAIDDVGLPDCFLGFYDVILIFDNIKEKVYISTTTESPVQDKIKFLKSKIQDSKIINNLGQSQLLKFLSPKIKNRQINKITCNYTKEKYIKNILKIKEYIKAGDVYQVNLSQRFSAGYYSNEPLELYKNLRKINPAPFSAFLNYNDFHILSSSPERFLKIENGIVETKPIKGTMPRGRNLEEDKKFVNILINSIKDKAEHIMIVDLERNDLGRVCGYGSVKVKGLYTLEKYASVFHLVSTVIGKLYKEKDVIDVLKACFPGGSITGAPKIRAIEIIDELEPTKRGIYTGSIGYIGFNGNANLNIAIRTLILKDNKAYFQLGGGIVIDSDPDMEYNETIDKGKAFFEIFRR